MLPKHIGINDYLTGLVNNFLTYPPVLWDFLFVKNIVVFDYISKANYQKPIPIALDSSSIFLIKLSILLRKNLILR